MKKFLKEKLSLTLHPNKTQIKLISRGVDFLGMRIYNHHRLIRKKNLRKFQRKYTDYKVQYANNMMDYDKINEFLEGWCAHSLHSNSFKFKQKLYQKIKNDFQKEVSEKEVLRLLKLV